MVTSCEYCFFFFWFRFCERAGRWPSRALRISRDRQNSALLHFREPSTNNRCVWIIKRFFFLLYKSCTRISDDKQIGLRANMCVCVVYVRVLLTTALVAACKLQIFALIKQKPVKIFPAAKAPSHQVQVACDRSQHINSTLGTGNFRGETLETVETIKNSFQPSGHRSDQWHSFYKKLLFI